MLQGLLIPHNPARVDKSEGGDWGVWVDWPERLLPMWLETLGEQSRLHLRTCFFLRHGGIISEGGQLHPGQIQILACAYATIAQSSRQSLAMQHFFASSSLSARNCSPALDLESTFFFTGRLVAIRYHDNCEPRVICSPTVHKLITFHSVSFRCSVIVRY